MNIKRFISGIVLFPIFALILIFGNKYIVDIFISIVAIMSLHEFYKAFKGKANPIQWPGYITGLLICFIHLIPGEYIFPCIALIILINVLILFTQVVVTSMKRDITDIAISLFGVCYIVFFLMFAPLIRDSIDNGKITFEYKDYKDNSKIKLMTLDALEFIRRFLMHILPDRFTKIKHYGLLSNRDKKNNLKICRILIGQTVFNDFTISITPRRSLYKFVCDECGCDKFTYSFYYRSCFLN